MSDPETTQDPVSVKQEQPSENDDKSLAAEEKKEEEEEVALNHDQAMEIVKKGLADIISTDPLLFDLPTEITLEEINSLIALEHGQAMMVNVRRADDQVLPIVVTQNASVLDLKHAIKRYVTLKQMRQGGKRHISWRYIWKRYWLYYDGQKLSEDKKTLKEYGIHNREEVTFIKKLVEKGFPVQSS